MKISFIIPAHNEALYIGNTIESILRQPREMIEEIIVVDNGSHDETSAVAGRYPLVKVVPEPVRGTNRARQTGFLASRGELAAFIDADVALPADWSQRVVERFRKNERVVGVSGPYWYTHCSWLLKCSVVLHFLVAYTAYVLVHYVFRVAGMAMGGNFIIRRTALEKIGGFNTSLKFWGDDTDTAKRLRRVGYVIFTPRVHVLSSTRRFRQRGWLTTVYKYSMNYFWVVLFSKPFSQVH